MTGTANTPDQAQIEKYQMCLKRGIKIKIFAAAPGGASVYSIQYSVYNFNSQLKYVYCIQFQLKSKRSLNGPCRIRFALAVKHLTRIRTFRACQVLDKIGLIVGGWRFASNIRTFPVVYCIQFGSTRTFHLSSGKFRCPTSKNGIDFSCSLW